MEDEKLNKIYSERNLLAIAFCKAAIAAGWNAGRRFDNDNNNWDEEWRHIITVDLPNGKQVSWHMSPSELQYIKDLPDYIGEWDGTFFARSENWTDCI